ncbi:hypothetical protein [Streptomyces sp. NPDC056190]
MLAATVGSIAARDPSRFALADFIRARTWWRSSARAAVIRPGPVQ